MKRPNPIAAQVQPLAGQPLPADWRQQAANAGGTYDRRDLENMWKSTSSNKPTIDSPTRNARLQPLSWNELYGQK